MGCTDFSEEPKKDMVHRYQIWSLKWMENARCEVEK
jgi:hypothetical protein